MAIDKHITLERLIQYKTRQDQFNVNSFLGVHDTADKTAVLANTRTIDGVNFNGSTNITLPTKIIHIYSDNGTFYVDSNKTIAFTASSYPNLTDKLFIDVTTGKSAYWDNGALHYIEAADTTPYIASSEKGAANGVAQLDNSGKVVSTQLPSFVDDVIEVAAADIVDNKIVLYSDIAKTQEVAGEVDKIYVDVNAVIDGTYRWGGDSLGFIKVGSNVTSAVSATRATQDGNGDVIDTTYVKAESGKGLMSDTQAEQLESLLQTQSAKEYAVDDDIVNLFKIKTAPSVSSESDLTYDGTPLNPVLDGYDGNRMTLSGVTSATNAGTYTLYATPKAGYTWDSTTGYSGMETIPIQWSIGKADPTVTLSKNNISLDSNTLTDTFTYTYNGDGNLSVSSSDNNVATCTTSGNTVTVTAVDNGTCNINIIASSGNNYNAVSGVSVSVSVQLVLVLINSNYKMSDVYPSTYTSMTTVPDVLDTSNVTSMNSMFYHCQALTTIPQLDTSSVTSMNAMFSGCKSFTTVPQLNTSNVTSMNSMFYVCESLTTVPQLNTSNVTSMNNMFYGCKSLTTVPQLNTSKVTSMNNMFYGCKSLTTVPQLNTSKVTQMNAMFRGCTNLTTVPQLDTSNATNILGMFQNCTSLPSTFPWIIDCSSISNANNMSNIFQGSSVTNVTLANVNSSIRSQITSQNLKGDNTLTINFVEKKVLTNSNYKMSNVYPSTYSSMDTIPDLLDISNLTNMSGMFSRCYELTTIPQLDTSNVTDMSGMFSDCESLTNISQLNTSNVTDMGGMFTECMNLTTIPQLDTSNVTNMIYMFSGCRSLTTIPQLNTSNVTNMSNMFYGCYNLTTIPQLNTSNVTDMTSMFTNCSSLPSTFPWVIDCSSISDASNMEYMFRDSTVTNVTLANVSDSIKSSITSDLLKGYNTLTINFV